METRVTDVRTRRISLGIKFRDLAQLAEVQEGDLRKWERGLSIPPRDALSRIARILSCDASALRSAQCDLVELATPGEGYTTAIPGLTKVLGRQLELDAGKIRVLDLFCGAGGFSFGVEQTEKFAVTGGIDLLPDRIATFRANHRFAASVVADIRSFGIDELGEAALSPEVIVGGPPCQGFSGSSGKCVRRVEGT